MSAKMSKTHISLILIAACLTVTACNSNLTTPIPTGTRVAFDTETPMRTPIVETENVEAAHTSTTSPTLEPSLTPTRTTTPTRTPILPTPVFPDWMFDDFLFGSPPPDCQLPCWQDLRINESSGDEVQEYFDTVFDFNGMIDWGMNYPTTGHSWKTDTAYARTHQWVFARDPLQQFTIGAWLDRESHTLKALNFRWDFEPADLLYDYSVQRMILELGSPSHLLVGVSLTERADQGNLTVLMLYDFGIKYGADIHIPIIAQEDNYIAEFCGSVPNLV